MRTHLFLTFVLVLATIATAAVAGGTSGIQFSDMAPEAALAEAKKSDRRVLVEVFATWCAPCQKQAHEVFDTADGLVLAKNMVPIRVDFDAADRQAFVKKYNVLSLPTILWLRADGTEIGRVEGYKDKTSFLAAAEPLVAGRDVVAAAKARLSKTKPTDKTRPALLVTVGHGALVRGDEVTGFRLLEEAAMSPADPAAQQEALFLLGRYLSRAKEDHAAGRHVWRELLTRFPDGRYRWTALYWYAGDALAMGHERTAIDALAAAATDETGLGVFVEFVEKHGTGRRDAQTALKRAKLSQQAKRELQARLAKIPPAKRRPPQAKKRPAARR